MRKLGINELIANDRDAAKTGKIGSKAVGQKLPTRFTILTVIAAQNIGYIRTEP